MGVEPICGVRDAVRRFRNLSDGQLFEIGASISFAGIRLPYRFYGVYFLTVYIVQFILFFLSHLRYFIILIANVISLRSLS